MNKLQLITRFWIAIFQQDDKVIMTDGSELEFKKDDVVFVAKVKTDNIIFLLMVSPGLNSFICIKTEEFPFCLHTITLCKETQDICIAHLKELNKQNINAMKVNVLTKRV